MLNLFTGLAERLHMIVNVKGRFEIIIKFSLLLFSFLLNACTPANPQFGFDFSSEKVASSLNLKTDVEVLNISNNAKVNVYGSCDNKSTFKLTQPIELELKCDGGGFSQSLDLSTINDGSVLIKVDEKNVFGDLISQQKTLIKDMLAPLVSIAQPANLGAGTTTINLSGSCSEEGVDVVVSESATGNGQSVSCVSSTWNMVFNLGSDMGINSFLFKAKQTDKGLNTTQVATAAVSRTVIGDYSISGVSITNAGPYTLLLKGSFNSFWVKWTAAVNVTNFDLFLYQLNGVTSQYDILKCSRTSLSGSSSDVILTGCNLVAGENYQVKMTATNTLTQQVIRTLNFATKALPRLRLDAKRLFVESGFDVVGATNIPYSEFIDSYDNSDGPFTVTFTNISAGVASYIYNDNANQKVVVSPSSRVSGVFSFNIQITDAFSNTSILDSGNLILAMPFSWVGLIDNDFNKAGNWCGSVSLHTGCQGSVTAPSFNAKVMIDDLCEKPVANSSTLNCSPVLSANAYVHSFFMKNKNFDQNGFNLTVGDVTAPTAGDFGRSVSFFKQTGGQFNSASPSSCGNLFLLNRFYQEGGVFYAPYASDFTLSSMETNIGTNVAVIANKNNFFHNNGRMIMIDPQGGSGSIWFDAPAGTELNNVKFATDGSIWAIRSDNLIINGDLEFGGTLYMGTYYAKLVQYSVTNKITLKGNLKCTGVNKGGNLPIYIDSNTNSTYSVTHSDCKFPAVYLANSNSYLKEDASSVFDTIFERLVISAGNNFRAPAVSRKLIINTEFSDTSTYAFSNSGVFDANNGTLEFQNLGDGTKEFILNFNSTLNKVNFVNNSTTGHFYRLDSDLGVKELTFSGSHSVNLRGYLRTVFADDVTFNKGLTSDPNSLSRIALSSVGNYSLVVNTGDRINIVNFAIGRNISLAGSSFIADFSGATIDINSYYLNVSFGYTLKYNSLIYTTGSFSGSGSANAGNL